MKLTAHDTSAVPDLTKVISKDETRPVLTCAYLDVDRKVLEATDSYRLASIPVEVEEGDVSGLIPGAAIKELVKLTKKLLHAPSLRCREDAAELLNHAEGTSQTWPRPFGTFPSVPKLIPEEGVRHPTTVGLNAKMLADLAAGMGSKDGVVRLQFISNAVNGDINPSRPMLVSVQGGGEAIGLLMPVKVS